MLVMLSNIVSFSARHNWQYFVPGLYAFVCAFIVHLMFGLGFSSLFQTCSERAVLLLFLSDLNECVWLLYLVLNGPSVLPAQPSHYMSGIMN